MANHLVPGALVASRYRVDRQLAEGGMGVIWAATHLATGERVALKLLRPDATEDDSTRRRLLREARAAAAVDHPNVPVIHDVLELDSGTPALVMDLLEGESLRDKLLRETRIPLAELSRLLLPVISAVGTAHALGIVHRDLKPDNIFLLTPEPRATGGPGSPPAAGDMGPSGTAPPPKRPRRSEDARVRVLDFGIAKLTAARGEASWTSDRTETGALLGTPYYMSPEHILGEHDMDHRADIWSLGVILYECLTSVRPTEAESMGKVLKRILTGAIRPIRELEPALPADVAAMIDRMLCPDRARRPADLREVGALLGCYAAVAFRPFGPPAAPREPGPESGALTPSGRTSDAFVAATADLDGEASVATLPAGSLLPPPPSSNARPSSRARSAALDATGGAALDGASAAGAPAAEGAAAAPAARARGASAALSVLAACVLLAAGAGVSLLRCSTPEPPETAPVRRAAPGARAPAARVPGDAGAPPIIEVHTPSPDRPERP
ncbi:serine/threonine-protein kinase [Sorangium sp. So ce1036]|uniref:serine/threonine-protein kinase n=1 Tax=Sorangium sp. So ce1036 TaxID=3133328 RepID=UPI003EFCFB1D